MPDPAVPIWMVCAAGGVPPSITGKVSIVGEAVSTGLLETTMVTGMAAAAFCPDPDTETIKVVV